MRQVLLLILPLLSKLLRSRAVKSLVAENILLKQQLLVLRRSRRRAPNLRSVDRIIFGFCSQFLSPRRLLRTAVILKPATLLRFHRELKDFKYRVLYSSRPKRKPGPKGPSTELVRAICELKRRNPRFGCPKNAQHLAKTFGIDLDKDVVRRVLAAHHHPEGREKGPSWLTLLGHTKDSLWSLDLFRIESILLRSHWVLVIIRGLSEPPH
jgi:putative transposase